MESQKPEFQTKDSVTTDLCVDYLQFCPDKECQDILLCTKYQLNEETKKVAGGFILFDTKNK